MKKNIVTVILSVLVSAIAAYAVVKTSVPAQAVAPAGSTKITSVNLDSSDYPDFTFAAENSVEAVVYIKVTVRPNQQQYQIDPFFRFFFGDDFSGGQPREQQGSGSGVIIRSDGYIVTNNHVVANATKIEVTLNNNKTYPATVIGTDPATDVALIKIDAQNLPAIEFADSDKLRLGEWVLAIGSPLGEELRSTITAGIVSAKGRSMPNYKGEFKIESFIQTDAAVNPGNSGGALVNVEGKLVGINTAIVSTTGSYSGYSFAVPSNIVKKIVGDLIDFGAVRRAKLGISMSPVTDQLAKDLKLSSLDGVYVAEVVSGGAADKAGIKKNDVLVEIDGVKMKSPSAVQEKVNSYHPSDKAVITVLRDGKKKNFNVVFQGTEEIKTGAATEDGGVAFYGASLKTADKARLQAYGARFGVEVTSAGSGAFAKAGGSDGLLIQYVNGQSVSSPKDVIEQAKKGKRAVYIEGVDQTGKPVYFGFAKE